MKISEEIQRMLEMPDPMKPVWDQLFREDLKAREAECNRVLGIEEED